MVIVRGRISKFDVTIIQKALVFSLKVIVGAKDKITNCMILAMNLYCFLWWVCKYTHCLTLHCQIFCGSLCEMLLILPCFSRDLTSVQSWESLHHSQYVVEGG